MILREINEDMVALPVKAPEEKDFGPICATFGHIHEDGEFNAIFVLHTSNMALYLKLKYEFLLSGLQN